MKPKPELTTIRFFWTQTNIAFSLGATNGFESKNHMGLDKKGYIRAYAVDDRLLIPVEDVYLFEERIVQGKIGKMTKLDKRARRVMRKAKMTAGDWL